jgi:glycerophosphoryl diester phosphodiesterase
VAHAAGNTVRGAVEAAAAGFSVIELDVQLTADGRLVAQRSHVRQTSDGPRPLREIAYEDVKACATAPPLVESCLVAARDLGLGVIVDVKQGPHYDAEVAEAVAVLTTQFLHQISPLLVISYDHLCLKQIRLANPQLSTGICFSGRLVDLPAVAAAADASLAVTEARFIPHAVLEQARANSLALMAAVTPLCLPVELDPTILNDVAFISLDPATRSGRSEVTAILRGDYWS